MDLPAITALIIDDDPADAELLSLQFKKIPGMRNLHCASVEEALSTLDAEKVDIVLIDYLLGSETGLEAMHRLWANGHILPVILITGQGDEAVAAEAFKNGATDYLIKDRLTWEGLRRAIGNALEKHHLRQVVEEKRQRIERSNRELRSKNEEIQSFYHTLSHELKTPLTSALEFISIVLDGLGGPVTDKQRDYLQIAERSCDLLRTYINDLIDVTRVETGKLSLRMVPTDITKLLDYVVRSLGPQSESAGITLSFETADLAAETSCDADRISQVVSNLLSNALKFTPEGGSISVRHEVDRERGDLVISVTDSGRGIAADQQKRIFERLYQVRADDVGSAAGIGVGLHLCGELVRMHGGDFEVKSELGHGSTFSFGLPLHRKALAST